MSEERIIGLKYPVYGNEYSPGPAPFSDLNELERYYGIPIGKFIKWTRVKEDYPWGVRLHYQPDTPNLENIRWCEPNWEVIQ